MVGDGPERKNLESLARSLGIFNAVLFTGVNLDVSTILPAMDAFILSSKTESFSNAILEAMAAGLPVIATDVGGNPESVLHGETGLLVPKENPEAMAKAMVELFNNPSKAASMGISGKKRVQIFFSWENSFRNLRNLYFSV
jgi:glycosyltransferase involved in cell wall biosynthesis